MGYEDSLERVIRFLLSGESTLDIYKDERSLESGERPLLSIGVSSGRGTITIPAACGEVTLPAIGRLNKCGVDAKFSILGPDDLPGGNGLAIYVNSRTIGGPMQIDFRLHCGN